MVRGRHKKGEDSVEFINCCDDMSFSERIGSNRKRNPIQGRFGGFSSLASNFLGAMQLAAAQAGRATEPTLPRVPQVCASQEKMFREPGSASAAVLELCSCTCCAVSLLQSLALASSTSHVPCAQILLFH